MPADANKLLSEALTLSAEERARMAAALIASLDGKPDEGVEKAWADEIERRARRALSGASVGMDWDQAVAQIEQEL